MSLNILFILTVFLVLLVSGIAYYNKSYSDIAIVKSTVDGQEYLVRNVGSNNPHSSLDAANILAKLKEKTLLFINNLKQKYNENHTKGQVVISKDGDKDSEDDRKNRLVCQRLEKNFRPDSLSESSSYQAGTSYSLNKGEQIVMCLRQKGDNSFVDINTLTYVLLHELTHLGTIEDQTHSPIFDRNFKFILEEAIDQGLYIYEPYHLNPVLYCGRMIGDTPLRHWTKYK